MNSTFTNIFSSTDTFQLGIPVTIYSITGNLDEDQTERIATWFSFRYRIPATALKFEGNMCLAIASDEISPLEIEDEEHNVRLHLINKGHYLTSDKERERKAIVNLVYRSLEQHIRTKHNHEIWLRYRSSRTYCEKDPKSSDEKSGVLLYSCFNIFNEYLRDNSIGLVLDSSSTLVEKRNLLEIYNSVPEKEFNSKFSDSWVLLTNERGERKTRFFAGVKKSYDIDSPLIHPFRAKNELISVRNKYHNTNYITGEKLLKSEPVAEIRLYKEDDQVDFVPLSCLQYTPDLDEVKEENEDISFSEDIYITPNEKFLKIQKYLLYFKDMEFGKYKSRIILNFNVKPNKASGNFKLPPLKFGGGRIVTQGIDSDRNLAKYGKINSLQKYGYYKEPELDKIIILHRERFDKKMVNQFRSDLLKRFSDYSLPFSEHNLEILSGFENIADLKRRLERLDEETLIGAIAIVNDRYFNYKEIKEVLNGFLIPSQAIREDTLLYKTQRRGRYQGILQNVVAGIVTKGDGIPWILSEKLSGNMFIGIDSGGPENKRSWASAYVFDEHGEKIHVTNPRYFSKEGIPKEDFKKLVLDAAESKLSDALYNENLEGITIHRDGFLTRSEKGGLELALNNLKLEDKLSQNFNCLAVNVKKGANYRLFSSGDKNVENPKMGAYFVLDERRAFISTTGLPLLNSPTSKPLLVEVDCIAGSFDIRTVIEDLFSLSELNWGSPTSTIKLPITTYYADKMVDFADYNSKPPYLPI